MRISMRQFDAIHFGHVHIEDGEVEGLAALNPLYSFFGRFGVACGHAPFCGLCS